MNENGDNSYLTGKLLLAMPALGDPRFHHSVILMCAHDENGAMGLVINRILPGLDFSDIVRQIQAENDIKNVLEELDMPVYGGGPVETARGFLLHSNDFQQNDTIQVNDKIGVTGTVDALKLIASGEGPQKMLFILGYAGWSPGQLESEIQQNAWLTLETDPEVVFDAGADEKWTLCLKKLGIEPSMLSGIAGRA
jgi:putative transcriptional regulator